MKFSLPAAGFLVLFMLSPLAADASSLHDGDSESDGGVLVTVHGVVMDAKTHSTLPGVAVVVEGKHLRGATTDLDGRFEVSAADGSTVRFECLGYKTAYIKAEGQKNITVALNQDFFKLDEIVVTGQGAETSRRRLSSSVETVDGGDLEGMRTGRIDEALRNSLPNVQITLGSGQSGTTSMIKSRGLSSAFGNSTPVIYVDGVRVDNLNTSSTLNNTTSGVNIGGNFAVSGSISDIPMENIERIEYVPGGAATTLYGSDAANGVIQIFTKKGSSQKTRFYGEVEMGPETANGQFYHFKRTKKLLHKTGFSQKYRFGFDGGTNDYGYSLGASMSNSTGTLISNNNEITKYSLQFGSRIRFNDFLEYSNSFGVVSEDFYRTRNGNEGYYTGLWFTEGTACANFSYIDEDGNTATYNPDLDANDDYAYSQMKALVSKAEDMIDNHETVRRFQTSQSLKFTPFGSLSVKGTLGVDYRVNSDKIIVTNEYLVLTQVKPEGTSDAGYINNFDRKYFGLTGELTARHTLRKDWFSLLSTAGFQFFSTSDHQSRFDGSNVRDGSKIISGAGNLTSDEWKSYVYSYGVFLQENVGIFDRLYLDLGLRSDYNSSFGDNVGWQFYPKVGLSYVLSDEPFMSGLKDSELLSNLRIFANYGVAGSYPPPFEYQKTIGFYSYRGGQAAFFGQVGNPDLGPEKKHSWEAGFSSVIFNGRLNLDFTYYYALTKGALFNIPSLPSSGQESHYLANAGKIENKGIELGIGALIVDSKDWKVKLQGSFNTNANKVLEIGTAVPFAIGGFSSRTVQTVVAEGESVGFLRGYKAVLNDDNSLKEVLPLQNLGNTLPKGYGNLSLSASYKRLTFIASGDWQYGGHVVSFDRMFRFRNGLKDPAIPEKALEGISQRKNWLNFTNFFVEKSDFLKIRNIGLSYEIRLKRAANSILLGFNVSNPFSFTSASVDPEAVLYGGSYQGSVTVGGINYSTFSLPRQYVFSIRLNL
jgi:outer membrane receptor protein involved in Fe transport